MPRRVTKPVLPADNGDQDQTATASTAADLGEAIPQIVEQLSQGDARWNPFRAQQKMTVTVVGGDCG